MLRAQAPAMWTTAKVSAHPFLRQKFPAITVSLIARSNLLIFLLWKTVFINLLSSNPVKTLGEAAFPHYSQEADRPSNSELLVLQMHLIPFHRDGAQAKYCT